MADDKPDKINKTWTLCRFIFLDVDEAMTTIYDKFWTENELIIRKLVRVWTFSFFGIIIEMRLELGYLLEAEN